MDDFQKPVIKRSIRQKGLEPGDNFSGLSLKMVYLKIYVISNKGIYKYLN
jgi:hypothetical protein